MKFRQTDALQRYIDSSFSSQGFIRSYLVLHSQREERRGLLEKIGRQISFLFKGELFFHEGKDWDFVSHALAAPSLFGDPEIIVWDGFKSLPEEGVEKFIKYLLSPSPFAFLLIGADSFKSFSSLYPKVVKELAVLDLSEEKPWDREKRQRQEMLEKAKDQGKALTPTALASFLALSEDSLTLESELMKVLSYVGDRSLVTEKDVKAITGPFFVGRWQVAEELVWERAKDYPMPDHSSFLALLGQLRFLLNQARQIIFYLQGKKSPEEIVKGVNIKSSSLQKIMEKMKNYKMDYFESALLMVWDLETLAKNSSLDSRFLFHYLRIKFAQLQKKYAR